MPNLGKGNSVSSDRWSPNDIGDYLKSFEKQLESTPEYHKDGSVIFNQPKVDEKIINIKKILINLSDVVERKLAEDNWYCLKLKIERARAIVDTGSISKDMLIEINELYKQCH